MMTNSKYSVMKWLKNIPNIFSFMASEYYKSPENTDSKQNLQDRDRKFIFSFYESLFDFFLEHIAKKKVDEIENHLSYYRYLETRHLNDFYTNLRKKMFLFYLQNYSFHYPKQTEIFFKNNFELELAIRYELDIFSLQDIYLCEYSNISYRLYFFLKRAHLKYSLQEIQNIIQHFVPVYTRFYILPFQDIDHFISNEA